MTHETRLTALQCRGYTGRHAAFLALVLVHSGYFLRRQHAAFLGVVDGSRTTDFVRALVTRHLARRQVYAGQTHVYQAASPLYDAIGEPNSRLQRAAEPAVITQRLMTLDVLIAHRQMPCLGTEREKVDFFTDVLHVPRQDLPGRMYQSDRPGVGPTVRYFVDRVPILVGADTTTFVYVPGWAPLGAFAAFLNAYTPLLQHVPRSQVLFCTADVAVLDRAQRMCARRFPPRDSGPVADGRQEVLAHFRARQRFERRQFRSFTDAEREQLRRDLARFAGPAYQQWYEQWCLHGDAAPVPEPLPARHRGVLADVRFVPFVPEQRYPFVSRVQEAA
jgi:hypothetical protein